MNLRFTVGFAFALILVGSTAARSGPIVITFQGQVTANPSSAYFNPVAGVSVGDSYQVVFWYDPAHARSLAGVDEENQSSFGFAPAYGGWSLTVSSGLTASGDFDSPGNISRLNGTPTDTQWAIGFDDIGGRILLRQTGTNVFSAPPDLPIGSDWALDLWTTNTFHYEYWERVDSTTVKYSFTGNVTALSVPDTGSSLVLVGLGLVGLGVLRRRQASRFD